MDRNIAAIQRRMAEHDYDVGPVDGVPGPKFWAAFDLVLPPKAQAIPEDYYPLLARIESGTRPYIKARTSSASGLYQFIRGTWIAEGGQWGPDMSLAFGGLRPSEEEQHRRARTFTQKNADFLQAAGIRINKATLYAAHFLGPNGARKILLANPNASIDTVTDLAQRRANPSILKGRVADFFDWLERKTGDRP